MQRDFHTEAESEADALGTRGRVCVRGVRSPARDRPADSLLVSSSGYESDYHPEPLTVEVQIQVNQCRSAEEALRTLVV